ncbi:MAG TPA: carbamoyltransferase C-terminal domain-containing protein [Pyrinomonadaceae bacterium]
MLVLGLCGGPDLVNEHHSGIEPAFTHDAASVLLEDGEVVFAIEEERLNRIKHTNKMPAQALRACLKSRGIELRDVDLIAYYSGEEHVDRWARQTFLKDPHAPELFGAASYFQHLLRRGLGAEVEPHKFRFVSHHHAHAMSAFAMSGFDRSLVATFDGMGDGASGMVMQGEGTKIEPVAEHAVSKSLGFFYVKVIAFLGYKLFDEYKVMGLAPYGNPETYRSLFRQFYTLLPGGDYELHQERLGALFEVGRPRRKAEPFTQVHKDLAASLQETLEEIAFHVLRRYREQTGHKNLCVAGGVAHNCTLNGKILRSGLFENVFVQPASHDAGAALGAAFCAYFQQEPRAPKPAALRHVYWGTGVGEAEPVAEELSRWRDFITFARVDDVAGRTAALLADGAVVGWVQGRSEFGPRALGNRSILADPRPAENKARINEMVKKREGYRPFAPSVLEEEVGRFFEVPADDPRLPFMVFVVAVKEEKRALLGAVTHVDGTARIQTVSRETNPKYWELIHAFMQLTGVPVLLNTSFNNNAEPIVNSVEDAVVCFLTTGLNYLVVGDHLVEKKEAAWRDHLSLKPSLPPHISLHHVRRAEPDGRRVEELTLGNSYDHAFKRPLPAGLFRLLSLADGRQTAGRLLEEAGLSGEREAREVVRGLNELWSSRLISLRP